MKNENNNSYDDKLLTVIFKVNKDFTFEAAEKIIVFYYFVLIQID